MNLFHLISFSNLFHLIPFSKNIRYFLPSKNFNQIFTEFQQNINEKFLRQHFMEKMERDCQIDMRCWLVYLKIKGHIYCLACKLFRTRQTLHIWVYRINTCIKKS